MTFDNLEETDTNLPENEGDSPPPEESNNRTFLLVAGVLGGLILLSIICLAIFAAVKILPDQQKARETALAAAATRQQDQIQQSLTQTAGMPTVTPTFTSIPPTNTKVPPTKTPLLAASATHTPVVGIGPATQTVIALKTQLAAAQTKTPVTSMPSAIPTAGFADEVGIPGLLGLSAVLLVVIFLARRMRTVGTSAR